jgi:hypothetical protein
MNFKKIARILLIENSVIDYNDYEPRDSEECGNVDGPNEIHDYNDNIDTYIKIIEDGDDDAAIEHAYRRLEAMDSRFVDILDKALRTKDYERLKKLYDPLLAKLIPFTRDDPSHSPERF